MPDSINIGRNAEHVTMSPIFEPVSGVRMVVDDDTEISKGDSTGYVLEIESPFATEAQTQWLLSKLNGIKYQPYTADKAMLNPAAEIGDYITTYGVFGGIFSQNIRFGSICASDVSAPQDNDVDHEYPYEAPDDRKFVRKIKEIAAEFEIQAGQIAAKVSQIGGNNQSFGWSMTTAGMYWYANGSEIMRATSAGLKVTGEINATSGYIGNGSSGFEIGSNYIRNGMSSRDDTAHNGVYIGTDGIALGAGKFKVDSSGNLTANSGTFRGNVSAGNIQYGGNYGTLNAAGLTNYTIGSNKYAGGSVGESAIGGGAVTNGKIGNSAVSYGKVDFTGTLDQVGVNKSNIEALQNGYFYMINATQVSCTTLIAGGYIYRVGSDGIVRGSRN